MEIEKSLEETDFKNEDYVYNVGKRGQLQCPHKWLKRSSVEDYKQ